MSRASRSNPMVEGKTCFLRTLPIGTFALRPLAIPGDAPLLHAWVTRDDARYWNMREKSVDEVAEFYSALCASNHAMAYLGLFEDAPAFLVERYDPAHDEIAAHYDVRPGDRGMHVLVAPAATPISGFTFAVMRTIMDFLFAYPSVHRIVVEPDVRNDKIHALNKRVGFRYDRRIELTGKTAQLAFCTREDYATALGAHAS